MNDKKVVYIMHIYVLLEQYFPINISDDVRLFIACQFALESAFGTSNLAKQYHNHSGMKQVHVRLNAQKPWDGKSQFGHYDCLRECILDYILCIAFRKPMSLDLKDAEHYANFIKGWYCPTKDYINRINSIINQFKSYQNGQKE